MRRGSSIEDGGRAKLRSGGDDEAGLVAANRGLSANARHVGPLTGTRHCYAGQLSAWRERVGDEGDRAQGVVVVCLFHGESQLRLDADARLVIIGSRDGCGTCSGQLPSNQCGGANGFSGGRWSDFRGSD